MKNSTKSAVKSFYKIWYGIQHAIDNGRRSDAGFDYGEWSSAYHDRFEQQEFDRVVNYVGYRFNIPSTDLYIEIQNYDQEFTIQYIESQS